MSSKLGVSVGIKGTTNTRGLTRLSDSMFLTVFSNVVEQGIRTIFGTMFRAIATGASLKCFKGRTLPLSDR